MKNHVASERSFIWQTVGNCFMMFLVCICSLTILVYVVAGKAGRTYEQLYRDSTIAQGQLIERAIEAFLWSDLPLRQFAGFAGLIAPAVDLDPAISAVFVFDERGERLFSHYEKFEAGQTSNELTFEQKVARIDAERDTSNQIVLPLRGRFENRGSIVLQLWRNKLLERANQAFEPLWVAVPLCSAGFALLSFVTRRVAWQRRRVWTAGAFATIFLAVAATATFTLVSLYADGAGAKGRALLASLSGRLNAVTDLGLNFKDLTGLDRIFADYRKLNADVSSIALVIDGIAAVHTDAEHIGKPWVPDTDSYEYVSTISKSGSPSSINIALTLRKDAVYQQVVYNIRNIAALFFASALFAYFFINIASTLQNASDGEVREQTDISDIRLDLIKPVFFLATFVENINYAFLPQFVQGVAQTSGVPGGFTFLPFMVYYLCFALSLLPGERAELRFGPRKLIVGGLIMAGCGLVIMAGELGFSSVVIARAISGLGQGWVFIGVQSYILRTTNRETRTRGAAIIVLGFQAGMIAGMAIGSLLVVQTGPREVFQLGAVVAALTGFYTLAVIPQLTGNEADPGRTWSAAWRNVVLTLRDVQFLKTIGLIGLPAKAVLTGVILFALPLLLSKQGFGQEVIGQITMMYAASVIPSSAWASSRAGGPHATAHILVCGGILSGGGLLMISVLGWQANGVGVANMVPSTVLIIAGVIMTGIGHGLINAPVITQVTETPVSLRLGAGPVAATYRLLERIGHTLGPMLVAQIIVIAGSGPLAFAWIGSTLIGLALIFAKLCDERPSISAHRGDDAPGGGE